MFGARAAFTAQSSHRLLLRSLGERALGIFDISAWQKATDKRIIYQTVCLADLQPQSHWMVFNKPEPRDWCLGWYPRPDCPQYFSSDSEPYSEIPMCDIVIVGLTAQRYLRCKNSALRMKAFPHAAIREILDSSPKSRQAPLSEVMTLFNQWRCVSSNMDSVVKSALGVQQLAPRTWLFDPDSEPSVPPLPQDENQEPPESTSTKPSRSSVVVTHEEDRAQVIQRVWRGMKARSEVSKMKERLVAQQTKDKLLQRYMSQFVSRDSRNILFLYFSSWRSFIESEKSTKRFQALESELQQTEKLRIDRMASAVGALSSSLSLSIFLNGWRRVVETEKSEKKMNKQKSESIDKTEIVLSAVSAKQSISYLRLIFASWRRFVSEELALALGQEQHKAIVNLRTQLSKVSESASISSNKLASSFIRQHDKTLMSSFFRAWTRQVRVSRPKFDLMKQTSNFETADKAYRAVLAESLGRKKLALLLSSCVHGWRTETLLANQASSFQQQQSVSGQDKKSSGDYSFKSSPVSAASDPSQNVRQLESLIDEQKAQLNSKDLEISSLKFLIERENKKFEKAMQSTETLAIVWSHTKCLSAAFSGWRSGVWLTKKEQSIQTSNQTARPTPQTPNQNENNDTNVMNSFKAQAEHNKIEDGSENDGELPGSVYQQRRSTDVDKRNTLKDADVVASVNSLMARNELQARGSIASSRKRTLVNNEVPVWCPGGSDVPESIEMQFADAQEILMSGLWADIPRSLAACGFPQIACGNQKRFLFIERADDANQFLLVSDSSDKKKTSEIYTHQDIMKGKFNFSNEKLSLTDAKGSGIVFEGVSEEFMIALIVVINYIETRKSQRKRASQRISLLRKSFDSST